MSPYRLAAHLATAFLTFSLLVHTGFQVVCAVTYTGSTYTGITYCRGVRLCDDGSLITIGIEGEECLPWGYVIGA